MQRTNSSRRKSLASGQSSFAALAQNHHQQSGHFKAQQQQSSDHHHTNQQPSFPPLLVAEKLKGELFAAAVQDRSSIKLISPNVGNGFTEAYEGQIDKQTQKRHGAGVLKWPNGNLYIGRWQQGSMHGDNGTFFYALEMDRYDGSFADDKKHGKGKYVFANGNSYEGEFREDRRNGHGIYSWQCGDTYEGQWSDGKMNGKGLTKYANGNTYDGHFEDDRREGYGVLKCNDGLVYDGEWHKNNRHGKGKICFPSGDFYCGEWHDDKKHGAGSDVMKNGSKFDGQYVHNVRCGKGTMVFANGDKYVGEFKDDKMHGTGKYEFSNGFVYDGEWFTDMRHGKGHYTFPSGHIYNGGWHNDRRSGPGKLIVFNGGKGGLEKYHRPHCDSSSSSKNAITPLCEVYVGSWQEGKMHGDFDVFLAPVSKYSTTTTTTTSSSNTNNNNNNNNNNENNDWEFRFYSGPWTNGAPVGGQGGSSSSGSYFVPIDDDPPTILQLKGCWQKYNTTEQFSAGDGTIYRPRVEVLKMLQATCEEQLQSNSNNTQTHQTTAIITKRKIAGRHWWQNGIKSLSSSSSTLLMTKSDTEEDDQQQQQQQDPWSGANSDLLRKCSLFTNDKKTTKEQQQQQQQRLIDHPIDIQSTLTRPIISRAYLAVKQLGLQDGALEANGAFESAACAQRLREGGVPTVDEIKKLLALDNCYDTSVLENGILADYAASFDSSNLSAHADVLNSLNQMNRNAMEIGTTLSRETFDDLHQLENDDDEKEEALPSSSSSSSASSSLLLPPWGKLKSYVASIKTLEKSKDTIEKEISDLKQETSNTETRLQELRESLINLDGDRQKLKSEQEIEKNQLLDQQKKEDEKRKVLEAKLSKARLALQKLHQERDDAEKEVGDLQHSLTRLTTLENSTKETASKIREEVQQSRNEVNSLTKEVKQLSNNSNNDSDGEDETTTEENTNNNNSNPTMKTYSSIAKLEKEIEEMRLKLAPMSKKKVDNTTNNNEKLQSQQTQMIDASFQSIHSRLNHFAKQCRGYMGAIAEQKDAEKELANTQKEINLLRSKSKMPEIERLRQAIGTAQERLEKLKKQEKEAAAERDARATLANLQKQLDTVVLAQEQEVAQAQNSLTMKRQTVEAISKARNELISTAERQKKKQQEEIEYAKKAQREKEERENRSRNNNTNALNQSMNASTNSSSAVLLGGGSGRLDCSTEVVRVGSFSSNPTTNNNNLQQQQQKENEDDKLAEKIIKARTKLEKKKAKLRKMREVVGNRIADIKSSGVEDPNERRSLDATATKESLMHQCIKQRSTLMQQMKKEISSSSQQQQQQQMSSSSTNRKAHVNSDDDDDDDDDDVDDFFSPSPRRKSINNNTTAKSSQQTFSSFAKDFVSAMSSSSASSDREKELYQGKVAVLESKLRIIQQLESECAEIPLLEEKLRAATKRM